MGFGAIAHPTKISMDHITGMQVIKPICNANYLEGCKRDPGYGETPTSLRRLVPGYFATYIFSRRPGVQAETRWMGSLVTPRKGIMFGCLNFFHSKIVLMTKDCWTS